MKSMCINKKEKKNVYKIFIFYFVDVMPVQAVDGVFDRYGLPELVLVYILVLVSLTTRKQTRTHTSKSFHLEIFLQYLKSTKICIVFLYIIYL
jgi:hypothetical protein